MDITEQIVQLSEIVFAVVSVTGMISPLLYYTITGDMIPAMPIYLPDMNAETFPNFILIICVQAVMLFAGFCLVYAFDTLTIVIIFNMLMVGSIIVEDIQVLETVFNRRKYSPMESKMRLKKIILMHGKYNEWVTDSDEPIFSNANFKAISKFRLWTLQNHWTFYRCL